MTTNHSTRAQLLYHNQISILPLFIFIFTDQQRSGLFHTNSKMLKNHSKKKFDCHNPSSAIKTGRGNGS